ncbi:carbohydrate ABC transporter permease, partial [Streptomyces cavourensis]
MNDTAFSRALLALRGQKLVTHAALILFGLAMLYPLLWMVSSSLKPEEVIFRDQGLIPTSLTFENFAEGWTAMRHSFGHYFL